MRVFHTTQAWLRWGFTTLAMAVGGVTLASRYYQFKLWRVSTFQPSGGITAVGITDHWDLSRGNIAITTLRYAGESVATSKVHILVNRLDEPSIDWQLHGDWNGRAGCYQIPLWMPFAFTGGVAVAMWRIARSSADLSAWRCGVCGYDRSGLAADAKCPECGTVPAPASK